MLNSLDPDLAGLIWVQTVCQGYQQMTLLDKELYKLARFPRNTNILHLSIFSPIGVRGWGLDSRIILGIPENSIEHQDIWKGKLDTFSRSSKLNHITNLMAHPRDFRNKVFANGWGISQQFFKIV